jgi:hypothetical protein
MATPIAREDGSFDASSNNLVVLNSLQGNRPADIVTDEASRPNLIVGNRCQTSMPGGLWPIAEAEMAWPASIR